MFIIISSSLMAILAFYLIWRLVIPLNINLLAKIIYSTCILLAAEKLLILRLLYGSIAQQDISTLTSITTGFMFSCIIIACIILIIHDLSYLIFKIISKLFFSKKSSLYSFKNAKQSSIIAIFTIFLSLFGTWQATKVPEIKHITLSFKDLPPELNNLKIVHLSDTHVGAIFDHAWLSKIVEKVNALEADAVLITGDVIDGSTTKLAHDISPLGQLKSKYGTFLAVGNHEYYHGLDPWINAFRQMGITVLYNEHKSISINNANLVIAGLTDPVSRAFNAELPSVQKAMENTPPNAFTIMLTHQPKLIEGMLNNNIQLVLAGHTHGGMIAPLKWLVALLNNGFVSGIYELNNMYAYINNGAGLWIGMPLRLGVPSEITNITIKN